MNGNDTELEFSLWYDENGSSDPIPAAREMIDEVMKEFCTRKKLIHKSSEYAILKPGDDRVPEVPKWLADIPDVKPRLLLATVTVSPQVVKYNTIVTDLDKKDLARLRYITREAYRKSNPGLPDLTDQECDDYINELGMEVVLDQLRSSITH